jgi:hypothetical protein
MQKNFAFEPPRQAFWLTDPEHGITLRAPIFVQDSSEQWSAPKQNEASAAWLK